MLLLSTYCVTAAVLTFTSMWLMKHDPCIHGGSHMTVAAAVMSGVHTLM